MEPEGLVALVKNAVDIPADAGFVGRVASGQGAISTFHAHICDGHGVTCGLIRFEMFRCAPIRVPGSPVSRDVDTEGFTTPLAGLG